MGWAGRQGGLGEAPRLHGGQGIEDLSARALLDETLAANKAAGKPPLSSWHTSSGCPLPLPGVPVGGGQRWVPSVPRQTLPPVQPQQLPRVDPRPGALPPLWEPNTGGASRAEWRALVSERGANYGAQTLNDSEMHCSETDSVFNKTYCGHGWHWPGSSFCGFENGCAWVCGGGVSGCVWPER